MNITPIQEEEDEEESNSNQDCGNDFNSGFANRSSVNQSVPTTSSRGFLEGFRQQEQQQQLQQGNISNEALGASVEDEQLQQYRSQLLRALLTARSPATLSRRPVGLPVSGAAVGEGIPQLESGSDQRRALAPIHSGTSSSSTISSASRRERAQSSTSDIMLADTTLMPSWSSLGAGFGGRRSMIPQSLSSLATSVSTSGNNDTPSTQSMHFPAHQHQSRQSQDEDNTPSTTAECSFAASMASNPQFSQRNYPAGQHFFNQFHTRQQAQMHALNDSPRVPCFEKAGAQTLFGNGVHGFAAATKAKSPSMLPPVRADLAASLKVPAVAAPSASRQEAGASRDSDDDTADNTSPFVLKKREPLPRSKEEEALLAMQRKFLEQLLKQDQENRGSRRRRAGSGADNSEGKEGEVRPAPRRRKPAYDVSVERNADGDHEIVWTKRNTKTPTAPRKRRKRTATTGIETTAEAATAATATATETATAATATATASTATEAAATATATTAPLPPQPADPDGRDRCARSTRMARAA